MVTVRLLSAIWICALLVIGAFGFFQIREERQRLLEDLGRRAALLGESLRESVESDGARHRPWHACSRSFGRPDRRIAVYDAFGSALSTSPQGAVVPPSLPEITDVIARTAVVQGLRTIDGRKAYVYATPLQSDDRTIGALGASSTPPTSTRR